MLLQLSEPDLFKVTTELKFIYIAQLKQPWINHSALQSKKKNI